MKNLFLLILFAIFSFNFLQSQDCPQIIFLYADACEAPDGKGEFLYFENGDEPINVDDLQLDLPGGDDICATNSCTWKWQKPDAAAINSLHDAASCTGTVFIPRESGETIPADSKVVLFSNKQFKDDTDWSGFCNETVYVLSIDKVANSSKYPHDEDGESCSPFSTNFTLHWGTYNSCSTSETVNYDPCDLEEELPNGSGGGNVVSFATGIPVYGAIGCDAKFSPSLFYNPLILLPAELSYFKGTKLDISNLLTWRTESEENTDVFQIERSLNGRDDFRTIQFLKAVGNSTEPQNYSIEDTQPHIISYYRLKIVAFDGSFEYSDIVVVERDKVFLDEVGVYPNPLVDEKINIVFSATNKGKVYASLSNIYGHQLYKKEIKVNEGINYFELDLGLNSEIQNVYILTLENKDAVYTKKILRNNMK